MNRPIKIAGAVVALFLLTGVLVAAWSGAASERILSRTFEVHTIDFPVPFPLTEDEVDEADLAPEEVEEVALARAIERGRHLVESRYACSDCHGADFGGGVMVDAPPIGSLLGPNLTSVRVVGRWTTPRRTGMPSCVTGCGLTGSPP